MTRTIRRGASAVALGLLAALALAAAVAAQTQVTGPSVAVDRTEVAIGDRLELTIGGFGARSVTMSICGNEARRGSIDCNMQASRSRETEPDGAATAASLVVSRPPTSCPCIVRVSSSDNREIAVAPIRIVGHPVGEVVGGADYEQPLAVEIIANPATSGIGDELRASLGGETPYDVTIQVTNRGTYDMDNISLAASFTRTAFDDARTIDVPSVGHLEPGATWEQTVRVDVPALTIGGIRWTINVSGAGPSVTSSESSTQFPILLVVVGLILLVDLLILVWRLVARLRRRRTSSSESSDIVDTELAEDRELEPV